jgi:hypothetical protein
MLTKHHPLSIPQWRTIAALVVVLVALCPVVSGRYIVRSVGSVDSSDGSATSKSYKATISFFDCNRPTGEDARLVLQTDHGPVEVVVHCAPERFVYDITNVGMLPEIAKLVTHTECSSLHGTNTDAEYDNLEKQRWFTDELQGSNQNFRRGGTLSNSFDAEIAGKPKAKPSMNLDGSNNIEGDPNALISFSKRRIPSTSTASVWSAESVKHTNRRRLLPTEALRTAQADLSQQISEATKAWATLRQPTEQAHQDPHYHTADTQPLNLPGHGALQRTRHTRSDLRHPHLTSDERHKRWDSEHPDFASQQQHLHPTHVDRVHAHSRRHGTEGLGSRNAQAFRAHFQGAHGEHQHTRKWRELENHRWRNHPDMKGMREDHHQRRVAAAQAAGTDIEQWDRDIQNRRHDMYGHHANGTKRHRWERGLLTHIKESYDDGLAVEAITRTTQHRMYNRAQEQYGSTVDDLIAKTTLTLEQRRAAGAFTFRDSPADRKLPADRGLSQDVLRENWVEAVQLPMINAKVWANLQLNVLGINLPYKVNFDPLDTKREETKGQPWSTFADVFLYVRQNRAGVAINQAFTPIAVSIPTADPQTEFPDTVDFTALYKAGGEVGILAAGPTCIFEPRTVGRGASSEGSRRDQADDDDAAKDLPEDLYSQLPPVETNQILPWRQSDTFGVACRPLCRDPSTGRYYSCLTDELLLGNVSDDKWFVGNNLPLAKIWFNTDKGHTNPRDVDLTSYYVADPTYHPDRLQAKKGRSGMGGCPCSTMNATYFRTAPLNPYTETSTAGLPQGCRRIASQWLCVPLQSKPNERPLGERMTVNTCDEFSDWERFVRGVDGVGKAISSTVSLAVKVAAVTISGRQNPIEYINGYMTKNTAADEGKSCLVSSTGEALYEGLVTGGSDCGYHQSVDELRSLFLGTCKPSSFSMSFTTADYTIMRDQESKLGEYQAQIGAEAAAILASKNVDRAMDVTIKTEEAATLYEQSGLNSMTHARLASSAANTMYQQSQTQLDRATLINLQLQQNSEYYKQRMADSLAAGQSVISNASIHLDVLSEQFNMTRRAVQVIEDTNAAEFAQVGQLAGSVEEWLGMENELLGIMGERRAGLQQYGSMVRGIQHTLRKMRLEFGFEPWVSSTISPMDPTATAYGAPQRSIRRQDQTIVIDQQRVWFVEDLSHPGIDRSGIPPPPGPDPVPQSHARSVLHQYTMLYRCTARFMLAQANLWFDLNTPRNLLGPTDCLLNSMTQDSSACNCRLSVTHRLCVSDHPAADLHVALQDPNTFNLQETLVASSIPATCSVGPGEWPDTYVVRDGVLVPEPPRPLDRDDVSANESIPMDIGNAATFNLLMGGMCRGRSALHADLVLTGDISRPGRGSGVAALEPQGSSRSGSDTHRNISLDSEEMATLRTYMETQHDIRSGNASKSAAAVGEIASAVPITTPGGYTPVTNYYVASASQQTLGIVPFDAARCAVDTITLQEYQRISMETMKKDNGYQHTLPLALLTNFRDAYRDKLGSSFLRELQYWSMGAIPRAGVSQRFYAFGDPKRVDGESLVRSGNNRNSTYSDAESEGDDVGFTDPLPREGYGPPNPMDSLVYPLTGLPVHTTEEMQKKLQVSNDMKSHGRAGFMTIAGAAVLTKRFSQPTDCSDSSALLVGANAMPVRQLTFRERRAKVVVAFVRNGPDVNNTAHQALNSEMMQSIQYGTSDVRSADTSALLPHTFPQVGFWGCLLELEGCVQPGPMVDMASRGASASQSPGRSRSNYVTDVGPQQISMERDAISKMGSLTYTMVALPRTLTTADWDAGRREVASASIEWMGRPGSDPTTRTPLRFPSTWDPHADGVTSKMQMYRIEEYLEQQGFRFDIPTDPRLVFNALDGARNPDTYRREVVRQVTRYPAYPDATGTGRYGDVPYTGPNETNDHEQRGLNGTEQSSSENPDAPAWRTIVAERCLGDPASFGFWCTLLSRFRIVRDPAAHGGESRPDRWQELVLERFGAGDQVPQEVTVTLPAFRVLELARTRSPCPLSPTVSKLGTNGATLTMGRPGAAHPVRLAVQFQPTATQGLCTQDMTNIPQGSGAGTLLPESITVPVSIPGNVSVPPGVDAATWQSAEDALVPWQEVVLDLASIDVRDVQTWQKGGSTVRLGLGGCAVQRMRIVRRYDEAEGYVDLAGHTPADHVCWTWLRTDGIEDFKTIDDSIASEYAMWEGTNLVQLQNLTTTIDRQIQTLQNAAIAQLSLSPWFPSVPGTVSGYGTVVGIPNNVTEPPGLTPSGTSLQNTTLPADATASQQAQGQVSETYRRSLLDPAEIQAQFQSIVEQAYASSANRSAWVDDQTAILNERSKAIAASNAGLATQIELGNALNTLAYADAAKAVQAAADFQPVQKNFSSNSPAFDIMSEGVLEGVTQESWKCIGLMGGTYRNNTNFSLAMAPVLLLATSGAQQWSEDCKVERGNPFSFLNDQMCQLHMGRRGVVLRATIYFAIYTLPMIAVLVCIAQWPFLRARRREPPESERARRWSLSLRGLDPTDPDTIKEHDLEVWALYNARGNVATPLVDGRHGNTDHPLNTTPLNPQEDQSSASDTNSTVTRPIGQNNDSFRTELLSSRGMPPIGT